MSRGLRFPKWATRSKRHASKPRQNTFGLSPYHRRLLCEPLEDRRLLSVLTVTKTIDDGSIGTLRYEISAAAAGDTIEFDPTVFALAQTITLATRIADYHEASHDRGTWRQPVDHRWQPSPLRFIHIYRQRDSRLDLGLDDRELQRQP